MLIGAEEIACFNPSALAGDMNFTIELIDDINIVHIDGSLDTMTRMRIQSLESIRDSSLDLVLDLQCVDLIDSAGLSTLVQIIRRYNEMSRSIAMVAPRASVLHILRMVSIDQIIPILDTLDAALEQIREDKAKRID